MLEEILEYERDLFLWINHAHTPFWDEVMWVFAGMLIWLPLLLVPLFYLFSRRKNWWIVTLFTAFVSIFASSVTAFVIKPYFTRLRPTNHPLFMDSLLLLNDYKAGGLYGFISGHSATAFAFAVFSLLLLKNKLYTILILLWAFVMAYSRAYLGVHFISDILAGMLIGSLIGWLGYVLYKYVMSHYFKNLEV